MPDNAWGVMYFLHYFLVGLRGEVDIGKVTAFHRTLNGTNFFIKNLFTAVCFSDINTQYRDTFWIAGFKFKYVICAALVIVYVNLAAITVNVNLITKPVGCLGFWQHRLQKGGIL